MGTTVACLEWLESWFVSDEIRSVAQSCRLFTTPWIEQARPPCPSPTPGVHSDSRPSSQWCHPAISSSVVPFSTCPQSLPASGSFPINQLFAWGGQSIGVSVLASFLPKKSQGWFSEWTGWISLQSKGLSRVFSNITVQKHQFFGSQPFLWWGHCLCSLFSIFLFIYLLGCTRSWLWHSGSLAALCGIQFPHPKWNPGPLYREHRVLASGPPGKSQDTVINTMYPKSWKPGDCWQGTRGLEHSLCQSMVLGWSTCLCQCHLRD